MLLNITQTASLKSFFIERLKNIKARLLGPWELDGEWVDLEAVNNIIPRRARSINLPVRENSEKSTGTQKNALKRSAFRWMNVKRYAVSCTCSDIYIYKYIPRARQCGVVCAVVLRCLSFVVLIFNI